MPVGYQLIIRLSDDRPIAPTSAHVRRLISSIGRIIGDLPVTALGIWAGHGHLEAMVDRPTAGELARRIEIGGYQVLGHGVPWERARILPIHDQGHARNLFRYIHDQQDHHGLEPDPFFEASNLPDLIGARITLSGTRLAVRQHLPSVRGAHLLEKAGCPVPGQPVDLVPELIGEAACAAAALPGLVDHAELAREVRIAAIELAGSMVPPSDLAVLLGVHPRTFRDLRRREARPELRSAIELQWRWRSHARTLEPQLLGPPSGRDHPGPGR